LLYKLFYDGDDENLSNSLTDVTVSVKNGIQVKMLYVGLLEKKSKFACQFNQLNNEIHNIQ